MANEKTSNTVIPTILICSSNSKHIMTATMTDNKETTTLNMKCSSSFRKKKKKAFNYESM